MAKLTQEEFDVLVDQEVQQAAWWRDSVIRSEIERNYQYYLGLGLGNEVEGRSQIVSWDVFETIESVLPDLLEIFLAGDNVADFEPVGPEDEDFAQQATDYINHVVLKQNPGFLVMNAWFKDALLAKLGIVRAYWNTQDHVKRERYQGLDEAGLAMLLDGEGVEVTGQYAYPDPQDERLRAEAQAQLPTLPAEQQAQVMQMLEQPPATLYDVEVTVTRQRGRVCIEGVRPETFIISRRATRQQDATVQGEVRPFTRSELVELGVPKSLAYDVLDYELTALDRGDSLKGKAEHESAVWEVGDEATLDKSTEEVLLFCGFVLADVDGDGVAEWRFVLRGGNRTLINEEADGPDYCLLTPIPIPHAIYGMALADPVVPIQATNTVLTRQFLDSLFLANNPRTYAMDGQVNIDDLLNNTIGGVVRVKNPQAVGPLVTANVATPALQGIEFMDGRRELRTGVTRYNQGLDADSLNKTASGLNQILQKGDRRLLMIARIFAETGVKDLFRLVLRLVCQNQDREAVIKLRGKWVSFDPRAWDAEMDVTVSTGLGSGDKGEQVALWQAVIGMQQTAIQAGSTLADETNVYQAMQQLMRAMGVKGAERYFKDPATAPPPEPPPPSPEQVIAQAEVEKAKIMQETKLKEIEAENARKQMDVEIEMLKLRQREAELGIRDRDSLVKADVLLQDQQRKNIAATAGGHDAR